MRIKKNLEILRKEIITVERKIWEFCNVYNLFLNDECNIIFKPWILREEGKFRWRVKRN